MNCACAEFADEGGIAATVVKKSLLDNLFPTAPKSSPLEFTPRPTTPRPAIPKRVYVPRKKPMTG